MTVALPASRLASVAANVARLKSSDEEAPDASVIVPVNAREDIGRVLDLIDDLGRYSGRSSFELVIVVNNYPVDEPPPEIEEYRRVGLVVVDVPSVWREGEVVSFTARVPGARAASSERLIHFDADCRIPNASALLNWYVERLAEGAAIAYTPVRYYDLRPLLSVRARMVIHHGARWLKRVVLRVPTARGSNYAIDRGTFLRLYDEGLLTDDLNVAPAVRSEGGRVVFGRNRELLVLTSGRRFGGGWLKLAKYLAYRLRYNLRVLRLQRTLPRNERNPFHRKPTR